MSEADKTRVPGSDCQAIQDAMQRPVCYDDLPAERVKELCGGEP